MIRVHLFWAYGNLSKFEKLSCNSFLKNGYDVSLWTYGEISNAPLGVNIRDAREILPESKVFLNKGSYANLADLFRLAVLSKIGGLWSDLDVICILPSDQLPNHPFLVQEDTWEGSLNPSVPYVVTNNIIYNPKPEAGNLVDLAYVYAERFPKGKIEWCEIGPYLINGITEMYKKHGFAIYPPSFANSIKAGEVMGVLLSPGTIDTGAHFIHLYNDMWRRSGTDKDSIVVPPDSILGMLEQKYN